MAIILKNNNIADKKPLSSQLELGELSINTHDAKIFFKDTNDNIEEISNQKIKSIATAMAIALG